MGEAVIHLAATLRLSEGGRAVREMVGAACGGWGSEDWAKTETHADVTCKRCCKIIARHQPEGP